MADIDITERTKLLEKLKFQPCFTLMDSGTVGFGDSASSTSDNSSKVSSVVNLKDENILVIPLVIPKPEQSVTCQICPSKVSG